MTEEEKVQLAALNKRVFKGEELSGQLKELHDHLKARAILPAPGNYLHPVYFIISFSHPHSIFSISVFYLLLMNFIWWDNFFDCFTGTAREGISEAEVERIAQEVVEKIFKKQQEEKDDIFRGGLHVFISIFIIFNKILCYNRAGWNTLEFWARSAFKLVLYILVGFVIAFVTLNHIKWSTLVEHSLFGTTIETADVFIERSWGKFFAEWCVYFLYGSSSALFSSLYQYLSFSMYRRTPELVLPTHTEHVEWTEKTP